VIFLRPSDCVCIMFLLTFFCHADMARLVINYLIADDVAKSTGNMDLIEYTPVTSLPGDEMLLLGNVSRPMELTCDEYVDYVDQLLRGIAQPVSTVVKTFNVKI